MDACTKATGTARLGIPSRVRLSPRGEGRACACCMCVRGRPRDSYIYVNVPHTRCTVTSIHPRNPPPRLDMRGGCGSTGREGYAGARGALLSFERAARACPVVCGCTRSPHSFLTATSMHIVYTRAGATVHTVRLRAFVCVCVCASEGREAARCVCARARTPCRVHGGEGMHTGSRVCVV